MLSIAISNTCNAAAEHSIDSNLQFDKFKYPLFKAPKLFKNPVESVSERFENKQLIICIFLVSKEETISFAFLIPEKLVPMNSVSDAYNQS